MSDTLIPGYQPPRHSPRLTLARVSGWHSLNADGSNPWIKQMPHSKGRIVYTTSDSKFARVPWIGPIQWVKSPYKLLRQIWKIIAFQMARIDTVQQAQAVIRSTRSEIIRMVKRTSPEDVHAWKKILKQVHDTLVPIKHGSVKQMRVRLTTMFGEQNFEDSIGRPLESGPTQAKMSAADRRGDEAIEDFRNIEFSMLYYFAVVKEFISELEHHIGLMEMDLIALSKKAFRGKKRYAQMRDVQAARYCINNILEVTEQYMWCEPFAPYKAVLQTGAQPLIHDLCYRDEDDFDTTLWKRVEEKAKEMLNFVRGIKTRIDLEHMRQALAESMMGGSMTPEVGYRLTQIIHRYPQDQTILPPEGLDDLLKKISMVEDGEDGNPQAINNCYEEVGNYLDLKRPAGDAENPKAATTA